MIITNLDENLLQQDVESLIKTQKGITPFNVKMCGKGVSEIIMKNLREADVIFRFLNKKKLDGKILNVDVDVTSKWKGKEQLYFKNMNTEHS